MECPPTIALQLKNQPRSVIAGSSHEHAGAEAALQSAVSIGQSNGQQEGGREARSSGGSARVHSQQEDTLPPRGWAATGADTFSAAVTATMVPKPIRRSAITYFF